MNNFDTGRDHSIQLGANHFHYLEWGPGASGRETFLLLHGLSSNAAYWGRVATRLGEHRVIALDQRHHGRSDRPKAGNTEEALLADVRTLIGALEINKSIVVGHSWGATVALDVAAAEPQRVVGLAVLDGPVISMRVRMTWEQAAAMMQPPLPHFATLEEVHEDVRPHLRPGAWGDDLTDFAERRTIPDGGGRILTLTAAARLQLLQAMYGFDPETRWRRLEIPVLLGLGGTEPPLQGWRDHLADAVQSLCPTVEVRRYDTGHDIPLEAPDEVAADLLRLARRTEGDPSGERL